MPYVLVAPPHASVPRVPDGFKAPDRPIRFQNPTAQQLRDAGDAAAELRSPSYATDFGGVAPDQGDITAALSSAKAWSDELEAADAWRAYVKVQRDLSWQRAFQILKDFRPIFEVALAQRTKLAELYVQTKAFLEVWNVIAEKAAETRAANKKAAKKDE